MKELEDNSDYYKRIIKNIHPYIEDLISILEGESADNYWSKSKHRLVKIEELKELINNITEVSYGAK